MLLHANPQISFFLSILSLENMFSIDSANCLFSVEMSRIATVFKKMEEFFVSSSKSKVLGNHLLGQNFAHAMKFSCCQEMTLHKMTNKSCQLKKRTASAHTSCHFHTFKLNFEFFCMRTHKSVCFSQL